MTIENWDNLLRDIQEGRYSKSELDLSHQNLNDAKLFSLVDALSQAPNVTTLDLSGNKIQDAGAAALATNTSLESLHLWNNKIGDAGAAALAANTSLTSLSLSSNDIRDEGAAALAANTSLTSLNLVDNDVQDAGARAFLDNLSLVELAIQWNNITPKLSDALNARLRHNEAQRQREARLSLCFLFQQYENRGSLIDRNLLSQTLDFSEDGKISNKQLQGLEKEFEEARILALA